MINSARLFFYCLIFKGRLTLFLRSPEGVNVAVGVLIFVDVEVAVDILVGVAV